MTAPHAGSLSDLIRALRNDKNLARTHVVHLRFAGEIDWQARVRDGATEDRRFANGQWTEWRKCSISGTGPAVLVALDDADRVATEAMRSLFAERRPCAGWVEDGGWWRLGDDATVLSALVRQRRDGMFSWGVCSPGVMCLTGHSGDGPTLEAAQLAAEDALLAVADAIRRAVGR